MNKTYRISMMLVAIALFLGGTLVHAQGDVDVEAPLVDAEVDAVVDEPVIEDGADAVAAIDEADAVAADDGPVTAGSVISSDPRFSTLKVALTTAGLIEAVSDPAAELTIFAPNNGAISALLADPDSGIASLDDLLGSANLGNILMYHAGKGMLMAADLPDSIETLLEGATPLAIVKDGETVTVNGIEVLAPDIAAGENAIIHMIGGVILPPAEFLPEEGDGVEVVEGDETDEAADYDGAEAEAEAEVEAEAEAEAEVAPDGEVVEEEVSAGP